MLLLACLPLLLLLLLLEAAKGDTFTNDPASTPAMYSGTFGLPLMVMDPNIYVDEQGYHLLYSSYFCKQPNGNYYYTWNPANNTACDIDSYVSAIGYAFSNNSGYSWVFRGTPVLLPGGEEWEQYKVETAFLIRAGNSLQMFYSALGYVNGTLLDNRYQIGVVAMNITDGVYETLIADDNYFQRFHPNPLIPYNLTASVFNNNAQEPSVVVQNNTYEVYYLGIQYSEPSQPADAPGQTMQDIGLGVSVFDDAFNLLWNYTHPMPNTSWSVNIPEVRYQANAAWPYMMVSASLGIGGQVHQSEFVQLSYSSNGINWTVATPALEPATGSAAFDNWACSSPTVFINNVSKGMTLFYSAFNDDNSTYLSSDGSLYCNYAQRYGIPISDPPSCVYIALGRATAEADSDPVTDDDSSHGLSDGAIAGVVVGSVAGSLALAWATYHYLAPSQPLTALAESKV